MASIVTMLLVVLAIGCTMVVSKPSVNSRLLAELRRQVQKLIHEHAKLKQQYEQMKTVTEVLLRNTSRPTHNIHYFQALAFNLELNKMSVISRAYRKLVCDQSI